MSIYDDVTLLTAIPLLSFQFPAFEETIFHFYRKAITESIEHNESSISFTREPIRSCLNSNQRSLVSELESLDNTHKSLNIRRSIQKFPHRPPGARTANGTALCHQVQLYRYFIYQSNEFYRHNPLCCFSTSNTKCKRIFRYRLSPETFGYTLVHYRRPFGCAVNGLHSFTQRRV
jgi:hypothetical protein